MASSNVVTPRIAKTTAYMAGEEFEFATNGAIHSTILLNGQNLMDGLEDCKLTELTLTGIMLQKIAVL